MYLILNLQVIINYLCFNVSKMRITIDPDRVIKKVE